MRSLILRTATRYLQPLLLLFSVVLLLRGHDEPGGGFAGGLVAAAAFALYSIAFGPEGTRLMLRVPPHVLMGTGLFLSLSSSMVPLFLGQVFFQGIWWDVSLIGVGMVEVGTPLLFDVGVYLVVLSVTLLVILELEEQ